MYLHSFEIFVKSSDPANPRIEILGSPEYQTGDAPVVGASGVDGLSDSALGNLFHAMSYFMGEPLPWAVALGLEGLCIVNDYNMDALESVAPTQASSRFWSDAMHVRSASEALTSGRRLQVAFSERNPEVVAKVASCPKGNGQTSEDVLVELSEQLGFLLKHLEWIVENRSWPVVSICFYD